MLVLTRKIGEQVAIGNDITVTVVRVGETMVRLGVDAPAGTSIARSELKTALTSPELPNSSPAIAQ